MPIICKTKTNDYNQTESLTLAFRVLPREIDTGIMNKSGTKTKKKRIGSMDVFNMHLKILDDNIGDYVYYSTDIAIDASAAKKIDQIIFFSYTDRWAARCKVKVIRRFEPFTPDDVNDSNTVVEWKNDLNRTWIKIFSYEQIDYESLNDYRLLNTNNKSKSKYLGDLIENSKRFSRAYVEI